MVPHFLSKLYFGLSPIDFQFKMNKEWYFTKLTLTEVMYESRANKFRFFFNSRNYFVTFLKNLGTKKAQQKT